MQHGFQNLEYNRWLVFGVVALGTFMATLDASIVNVVLPVIANNLGADLTTVQWVVSAYLLTISSLLPIFGRVGDMYGRRLIYSFGFLVFTFGSVLCGSAGAIWMLVGARVLQAIGASMLMANAPALITLNFPAKMRGRALGMSGTVVALGTMTGPSLGGFLAGSFGWESIFYINVPIGLLGCILGLTLLPHDKRSHRETFDWPGAVLFSVGLVSLLLVLSHGQEWGWCSPGVIAALVVTFLTLGLFVRRENKIEHPIIDFKLFQSRPFFAGSLAGLLSFMAIFSNIILLPFYLHSVLNLSPTQMGLLITPFPLVMALVAPVSGYLSDRTGPVLLTVSGLFVVMAGLLYLATLGVQAAIWQVALAQAILGFGNGLFQSPNNSSVLGAVHPSKAGVAGGINALVRNIGMVSGIAVSVAVFEISRHHVLADILIPSAAQEIAAFLTAYHTSLVVGAFFAGIGAVISLNRRGYVKGA